MSTKDLFNRNYLKSDNEKDAFSEAESSRNVRAQKLKQDTFLPQVDYTEPSTFAKFGSARLYYDSAISRIINFYPYDGSEAELTEFYNKSLDIEKYIFNSRYPRTTGYVNFSPTSWGTTTMRNGGYGSPSVNEYITFKGGPNSVSQTQKIKTLVPDDKSSKFKYSNIYDESIYSDNGYPSDYGSGTRTSNLRSNFDDGVTIEFWAKTGSLSTSLTQKQIVADFWNNAASSSADYGRITVELDGTTGASSPWLVTVGSGSTSVYQRTLGTNINIDTLADWRYYSFVLQNSGSDFHIKLYVNGELNDTEIVSSKTVAELNPENMMGRVGALLTAPSGSADATEVNNYIGAGKLSGSLDEFRFWKVARNAKQIGQSWFTQIRGGVNTDIANTTLGMYYKFNEGITDNSTIDSVVLDYGGRLCNGTWTGYSAPSRNTGSAIVSASAAGSEYLDPIIYADHPSVVTLKNELLDLGIYHDSQNNAMFLKNSPSWIIEETLEDGTSDLERLSHIIGAYFDKLYLQIQAIPTFRHATYTSASHEPFPFSQHLPQSLGLYTPEIFIDSDVLEKFANRNNTTLFQQDLNKTKNVIYQNIYNNLASIYKSKGTERSIRNVLRCFNIDDNLIYLNTYANNQLFQINNNLKQTQKKKRLINLNKSTNTTAVVYQSSDPSNSDSRGFISGSGDLAYEDKYGFTAEVGVKFPKFFRMLDTINRDAISTISLFGMHSASVDDGTDTTIYASDNANFQVHAIRDATYSKNVYFKLSSSLAPFPIPELTTSVYYNVYDDEDWNLSVALKPPQYPYAFTTSGSDIQDYDVVFRGYNNKLGTVDNSFELTASVTQAVAKNLLQATKRVFIGATNVNITGSNTIESDVMYTEARYWTKYLDSYSLKQHSVDRDNFGISGSYRNIDAVSTPVDNQNSYNFNSLALNWYFQNVTSSDASGDFYVTDLSSGSALIRDNFGWAGKIGGYPHTGRGSNFAASDTDVTVNRIVNEFKFIEPERVVSSDMVKILSDDDEVLGTFEQIPNYVFIVEKSLYSAVSEEILDFFAGSIDFNNLIGDPVNRYRMEYKAINYLRNIFFERVGELSTVEKYIDYYKWFDDSIAEIIAQLVPASAEFVNDVYNTIESHVLERNKYQSRFPTIEFNQKDPETSIRGVVETKLRYEADMFGGIEASPRPTDLHIDFWKKRALPGAAGIADFEITSSDAVLDTKRRSIRAIKWSRPEFSGSMPILTKTDGTRYTLNRLLQTQKAGTVDFTGPENVKINRTIKGGVNFDDNKDIHYTYTSLYPAGPVYMPPGGVIVPQNVLFAETNKFDDITSDAAFKQQQTENANKKRKRFLKVDQGRDYTDGLGYTANKNSFAFPFNVMSASISGGVDDYIKLRTQENITITNLHNDAYGADMEIPMQGPFTNYAVGGHQSRHVPINISSSTKSVFSTGLDNYLTRPEAWKLLLGKRNADPKCSAEFTSGAIGMTAPDYPWPEANAADEFPYPVTASEKAVYYRDFIAKRPVNIRNIQLRTGSTILGNYQNNYDVVMTNGAYENPRQFVENQPDLPSAMFQNSATSSTQARTFMDVRRLEETHFEVLPDYNIGYLTGTVNKTVILSRFDAVGGMLTSGKGYRDFRSNEFSVYNDVDYKNIAVTKPSQPSSGTFSEPPGVGTPGIRVFDIHGRDVGLTSHYSRYTAKFGRDPYALPAINYNLNNSMYIRSPSVHTYGYTGGLQAWWRLNENVSSAGDVADSSGNGRVGSFTGASNRPAFASNLFPNQFIQTGSCTFDGGASADDSTNIGSDTTWDAIIGNAAGSTEKMTLSAWIRPLSDGNGNFGRVIDFGAQDVAIFVNSESSGATYLSYSARFTGGIGTWRTTSRAITLTEWTHVAVTFDATSATNNPIIYINGVSVAITEDSTPSGDYDGITTQTCHIGNRSDGTRAFDGQLADIAVWNTILADSDVLALAQVGNVVQPNSITLTAPPPPGETYDQLPGYHKVHRNNKNCVAILTDTPTPVYEGSTLNNTQGVSFTGSNPNPTFLLTGSHNDSLGKPDTKAPLLLNSITGGAGNSLSWTGLMKFHNDVKAGTAITEQVWGVGCTNSTTTLAKLEKVHAGSGDRPQIHFSVATTGGGGASEIKFEWHFPFASFDLSGTFNHYALVWNSLDDGAVNSNFGAAATLYFNGVSQSAASIESLRPDYRTAAGTKSSYRGFSAIKAQGAAYMNIGGGLGASANPLSASIDEFTFWTTGLNSTEVSALYNSGVPCDVTASTAYTDNSADLWDWIRFENSSDTNSSMELNHANPGIYNGSTNNLVGFNNNQFLPLGNSAGTPALGMIKDTAVPAGCTQVFVRYDDIKTFMSHSEYDNLFVHHQIPRMSKQYAWITSSLVSDNGICGFYHPTFTRRVSSSTGISYLDSFDFVTASSGGSVIPTGLTYRRLQENEFGRAGTFLPQTQRLNLNILEDIDTLTNTLIAPEVPSGLNVAASGSRAFVNWVKPYGAALKKGGLINVAINGAAAFNNLMFKRGNQFGYPSWKQVRQQDHQILTRQRLDNKLNIFTTGTTLSEYDLRPVSMVGRPSYANFDFINSALVSRNGTNELIEKRENVTLKTSYNNEYVLFNQKNLNDFIDVDFDAQVTPFEQLVALKDRPGIELNWVLYKENVYPSIRNEFASRSVTRVGYDSGFWRDSQAVRVSSSTGLPNSFGVSFYDDYTILGTWSSTLATTRRFITQSIWPLDAPLDFKTRTGPPRIASNEDVFDFVVAKAAYQFYTGSSLIGSNSAGELQNTYSSYHFNVPATSSLEYGQLPVAVRGGALYARKHMLASPLSLVNPAGPNVAVNTYGQKKFAAISPIAAGLVPIVSGAGEAMWEADRLAGYLTTSNGITNFVSAASEPFYDTYDDFRADIKLLAKGYSIVPEFRISERVENYTKFGILGGENFDTFDIPGTTISSSQNNFYKDYSNSDFLEHFLDVRQMSDLTAKEIKLTCRAAIKFHPYKGFYPAQRSLDLVKQFRSSYGDSITSTFSNGAAINTSSLLQYSYARPVVQPLFAPGILYNSIKSGIAVDYPITTKIGRIRSVHVSGSTDGFRFGKECNFLLASDKFTFGALGSQTDSGSFYVTGNFFGKRLPFETIMNPGPVLNGVPVLDSEPHLSMSFANVSLTASINGAPNDNLYTLMASNYFAEVGKFFLNNGEYTKLESNGLSLSNFKFGPGEVYGARLRMKCSFDGGRTYDYESGSDGENTYYSAFGARSTGVKSGEGYPILANDLPTYNPDNISTSGSYELPQDPSKNPNFKKNFVMYSRTTAFGPPFLGRLYEPQKDHSAPFGISGASLKTRTMAVSASIFGAKDSLNGFNWSYTPPYYDGEAWVDFIFRPTASIDYDLNKILSEVQTVTRRYDPGENLTKNAADINVANGFRTLHLDKPASGSSVYDTAGQGTSPEVLYPTLNPYSGENINSNAMQLDASINLFGVENVQKTQFDKFGQLVINENEVAAQKWVIQPKFETPMMNFADSGVRAIKPEEGSLTLPTNFGSDSVPRGMWHQFGVMPEDNNKGIFLEIGEIPETWLKNHYEVIGSSSIYNDFKGELGPLVAPRMKSFTELMGFTNENSNVRLGEVAEKRVIKEAVVAVPYILEGLTIDESQPSGTDAQARKKFLTIPEYRFEAAMDKSIDSLPGNSLNAAGQSIRRQVNKMKEYVLPPQFDFIGNKNIDPLVMYFFEFKYELDRDDLSYIWQNLSPRNSHRTSLTETAVAHELVNTELLTENNLLANPNLRWMVFKVKQRSQTMYEDVVVKQANQPVKPPQLQGAIRQGTQDYNIKYNWPYDYVSIIEAIQLDSDVLYKDREPAEPGSSGYIASPEWTGPGATDGKVNDTLNKKKRRKRTVVAENKKSEFGANAKFKKKSSSKKDISVEIKPGGVVKKSSGPARTTGATTSANPTRSTSATPSKTTATRTRRGGVDGLGDGDGGSDY